MSQSEKKITQDSAKSTETTTNKYKGFSEEERAAMKERAKEQKAEARASGLALVLKHSATTGRVSAHLRSRAYGEWNSSPLPEHRSGDRLILHGQKALWPETLSMCEG